MKGGVCMNQLIFMWVLSYVIVAVFAFICYLLTPKKNKG